MDKKTLARKLNNHRFTIVSQAVEGDKDVAEFKLKERQAKARAEKRAEIEARNAPITKGGITVSPKEVKRGTLGKAILDQWTRIEV